MKKRLISLFCVLALMLCTLPAHALEGDQQRAAEDLSALGLVQQSTDYRLSANATRLQAITVLSRMLGQASAPCPYTDVPAWAAGSAGSVSAAELLKGIWDGAALRGDTAITADEWCALLLRLAGQKTDASGAAAHAQRLGMISRSYGSPLTRGDLFELTREALGWQPQGGTSIAAQMAAKGLCTADTLERLRICPDRLTVREAADRHMAAVACLSAYSSQRNWERDLPSVNASAFFIHESGIAVTNYHSLADTAAAAVTLTTGEVYPVEGVLWADKAADLAVIRVSRLSRDGQTSTPSFAALTLVGTKEARAGDTVYALGNPLGLGQSVSAGIISAMGCVTSLSTTPCLVSTAPISTGSSGGALLNEYGHVVAVTSGALLSGNAMYLSVPVDALMGRDFTALKAVSPDKLSTLS